MNRHTLARFDFIIPLLILPIICLSHILVSEANDALGLKQYVYFAFGFLIFFIFFLLPLRKFHYIIPIFYWINIVLLFCVDIFGVEKLGAKRWLEIPVANFTLQPSELMKPAFILMLSYLIKQRPPCKEGYNFWQFLKLNFYILLPFGLILKEPDLGTALVLLLTGYGVLFVVGVNKKIWIFLALIIGISSPIIYENLHDYQKKRITDFLSEEPSYHVKQSIIAIGNGGIYGKSKDEATQTHFKFLPIATSDFIFAYNNERFGFISAIALMSVYLLLIIHLLSLNYYLKDDYMAVVVATSLAALIFIYTSINIAMTIGLAPVVGVPLPFFSYGGSSFLTFMALFGMLENLLTFKFKDSYKTIQIRM